MYQFDSKARINSLHWITSLRESERGVTRRICEDLKPMCAGLGLPFFTYEPATAEELLQQLEQIAAAAGDWALPLIHLDLHGSLEDGLFVEASGECVGWPVIADKFRAINLATGNNLIVVSGACFSFRAVKQLAIDRVTPFFMLLAPEQEILAGDIEANTRGFYNDLFDHGDFVAAHDKWFGDLLRMFHSERMLAVVLAKYINETGMGKQKARRREELVTNAVAGGVDPTSENLRDLRSRVDQLTAIDEGLIDRFLPIFLGGKQPGFSVAELKAEIALARAEGLKPEGRYA